MKNLHTIFLSKYGMQYDLYLEIWAYMKIRMTKSLVLVQENVQSERKGCRSDADLSPPSSNYLSLRMNSNAKIAFVIL